MIYDYPQYYEVAFSFRDITREADFMARCIERFSDVKVRRVFEVGCGYAPHAGALADHGYQYLGLDNNRNMLDYAAQKWSGVKPTPEFLSGDMVNFELPRRIDFAFVMLGSLYVNTLDEMTSHFDSMAKALKSGGLYFLDWCVQFDDPMRHAENNTVVAERDGITVESKFNIRLVDPDQQMYEEIWTVDVNDHGNKRRLQMIERNRAIFPSEFLTFVRTRTDFELVGWWRDWDLAQPITDLSSPDRPVALLRRK